MRYRTLLVVAFVVVSLFVSVFGVAAEVLTNDSRKTAVAVRITFMTRVMITGHGREFFTQEPASGLSDVFVFSGGEVRINGTFVVEWSPGLAIKSVEWLEIYGAEEQQAMEEVPDCSCILSPGDSLESRLNNAYDGIEICLEPGEYAVSSMTIVVSHDITIRGIHTNLGVAQIIGPLWLEPFISVYSSRLSVENISWVSSQIIALGSAVIDIKASDMGNLLLTELSSANVEQSSLSNVTAADASTSAFVECVIGNENEGEWVGISWGGMFAKDYAVVSMVDSIIRNALTGISAYEHAVVRVTRGEFVNCGTDTSERGSGVIEID